MRASAFRETIRFRLALGFAVVVSAIGALVIGGLYAWESYNLHEPVIMAEPLLVRDAATGELVETDIRIVFPEEQQRVMMEKVELDAYRRALGSLRRSVLIGIAVVCLMSFLAGWMMSGWALAPVRRITGVARGITATDIGRRIGLRGPRDELRDLADTFDSMLDRLEVAFDDQRRFVADASHELRNPLAVARTNLEFALAGDDPHEIRDSASIAHAATERMSVMVDQLLIEAREALPEHARTTVDLAAVAGAVAADYAAQARSANLRLDLETRAAIVRGDGPALRRALSNLVANAIRLAPAHSSIVVSSGVVEMDGGQVASIAVTDAGPGLSAEDRSHVFDRFWQGSGQAGAGAGLGLAIVARTAERHGGTAVVEPAGTGSRFEIRLPCAESTTGTP